MRECAKVSLGTDCVGFWITTIDKFYSDSITLCFCESCSVLSNESRCELQMRVNSDKWRQDGTLSNFGVFQLPTWWKLQGTADHTAARPDKPWHVWRFRTSELFNISLKTSRCRVPQLTFQKLFQEKKKRKKQTFITNLQATTPGEAQQRFCNTPTL